MFTIGCHLSSAKGYLHMAKDAVSIDANTFQFFTRNPRGGRAKAIDPKDIAAFAAYAPEHGIERILAHAPYTLYNMHPGSAVGQPCEVAIAKIADALNQSLLPHQTTTLLLETMAGKGSEIGGTFEELAAIIAQVELESHVGVCLDTCHVWDAGYDIVGDLDGVLEEFDRVIGLDRLHAIHLNDSMNARGSHKDRHARIGEGEIGFKALAAVTNHPKLRDLPFYLETPNSDLAGYAEEIAALRRAHE